MLPKTTSICLFMLLMSTSLMAQQKLKKEKRKLTHIGVAFTNSHTALPFGSFSKLLTGNYHPGIEISTALNWKTRKSHDWIQTFNAGYSYHHWVQHSIVLYTELGYRLKFPAGLMAETKLGAGYMRAIVASETFSDGNKDGRQYGKLSSGRSQAIASFSITAGKQFKAPIEWKLFMEYQQRLQSPFIQSYVPLLPYNILKFGVSLPIHR